ncbi:MAG: MFS transporter [Spirochaetia bacterium]|jgi:OFA family oxalate/formate antiporter-like MFS transporter|nr:MFS transporter [Spirochaetia bacterium]
MKNKKINQNYLKLPFNYGWIALIVGTTGILMSIPGQTMGVSVFTDYIIQALSISRTGISTSYMIGTIASALLLARAGKFYDKFGAKITGLIASVSLGLILLYLSKIDKLLNIFGSITNFSDALISFILLVFGFFVLRFFGQGIMAMVSRNMVLKWFDKKRGFIAALMGSFTTFGFSYAPKILNTLIDEYTWQGAWRVLAITVGIAFTLIILVFYRDNIVEQKVTEELDSTKSAYEQNEKNITLKEALRTRDFWSYNLALAFFALFNTAFTFHIVSIFSTAGIDRTTAVAIFIPISIIAVGIRFIGSTFIDYINLKFILILELAGTILSSLAIINLSSGSPVILLIIGMGASNGAFGIMLSITWITIFGKKHLGAISGAAMGWTVAGSAVGPFLFSILKDIFGNYTPALMVSITLSILLLILPFYPRRKKYYEYK